MEKTMVVWRRLGKEHSENKGYQVNSDEMIHKHITDKLLSFRKTPDCEWRWWHISEQLIIEMPSNNANKKAMYYYYPQKNWLIVKDFDDEAALDGWKWYVHIGNMAFDESYNSWIFTDWFSDVIVQTDGKTNSVLDLDELGQALTLGLINADQIVKILSYTQELVDTIRNGQFPPAEINSYSLEVMQKWIHADSGRVCP